MNDEQQTQQALDGLKNEPESNMPEGLEVFEPKNDGLVKNINQQETQQFVAKDIGFSQNTEEKKNEIYNGPVSQARYDNSEMSQSFNSANTTVHKSQATRNRRITLIVLLVLILAVVALGYSLSSL